MANTVELQATDLFEELDDAELTLVTGGLLGDLLGSGASGSVGGASGSVGGANGSVGGASGSTGGLPLIGGLLGGLL